MKGNSLKEISLKHLFKKENALFITIITILILIIYVLLTISNLVVDYYYSMNRYNYLSRTLIVEKGDKSEKDLDDISNINHVVENVSNKYYNEFFAPILERDEGQVAIGAIINNNDLKIVKGRNPENLNEIVIPVKFCPYNEFDMQKDKFINGNKLIGTTFTIKSDKSVNYNLDHDDPKYLEMMNNREIVTLTIVGTYDSTANLVEADTAFATMETIDNLKSPYHGGHGINDREGNSTFIMMNMLTE